MKTEQFTAAEQELFKTYTHIEICKKFYGKGFNYKETINNIEYYDEWFSHFDSYVVPQLINFINKLDGTYIKCYRQKKKQLIMNIFHWWFGVHPINYPDVHKKYFE